MKPNIERLWDSVNEYQRGVREAQRGSIGNMGRALGFARQLFKQRLEALGVADAFDWTDEAEGEDDL